MIHYQEKAKKEKREKILLEIQEKGFSLLDDQEQGAQMPKWYGVHYVVVVD